MLLDVLMNQLEYPDAGAIEWIDVMIPGGRSQIHKALDLLQKQKKAQSKARGLANTS